jgi:hypothetical protein
MTNLRRGGRPDHRRGRTKRAGSLPAARQGMTDEKHRMVDGRGIEQLRPCQRCRPIRRDDRAHSVRLRSEIDNVALVADCDRHRDTAREHFSVRMSTLK